MRYVVLLLLLAACASEPSSPAIQHSQFFQSHEAIVLLQAALAAQGLTWKGSSNESDLQDSRGERRFSMRFDGGENVRIAVVRYYQIAVLLELKLTGLEHDGHGSWPGLLNGFCCHYGAGEVTGSIHVYSAATADQVEIRGVIEEHRDR